MKMSIEKKLFGVIADDFTGASDAASFLAKTGNRVVMVTSNHINNINNCDCIVAALKIRSVKAEVAIKQVNEVLKMFNELNVDKIYYKFCSTFDSTPEGNIGVVMDYLLELFGERYTILVPSLPVNGRIVKNGSIYVNGILLSDSSMKNHPLNPMWDSYIPNLMKPQSKYNCYVINEKNLDTINHIKDDKFYLIPDYENYEDGKKIALKFKDLKIFGGGSGILEHFCFNEISKHNPNEEQNKVEKAIIVCGSCSKNSALQIAKFKENNKTIKIDSLELLDKRVDINTLIDIVEKNLPNVTLIYSDGIEKDMNSFSKHKDFKKISNLIEQLNADLCVLAIKRGFNKIIVAGGETSGAVILKMKYNSFLIGTSIAPGVPILIPLENNKIKLVLKSGNFGDENFFDKAIGG
ncbi:MAG: four-carbon acid sugar kinase family protein [Bacilli bacterium]|uniref:four-carbon acid sugar kinase family protein n=1 Tax=Anaerorhabdus sp. TaxID=1872524 RepID=UPI002FCA8CBF